MYALCYVPHFPTSPQLHWTLRNEEQRDGIDLGPQDSAASENLTQPASDLEPEMESIMSLVSDTDVNMWSILSNSVPLIIKYNTFILHKYYSRNRLNNREKN